MFKIPAGLRSLKVLTDLPYSYWYPDNADIECLENCVPYKLKLISKQILYEWATAKLYVNSIYNTTEPQFELEQWTVLKKEMFFFNT